MAGECFCEIFGRLNGASTTENAADLGIASAKGHDIYCLQESKPINSPVIVS